MTYITPEGYNLLKTKLKELWKKERPYVTQKVKEAAALGDRSENAEYIYGKRQLREIDRKIRLLSGKLDSAKVIDRLPKDRSKVYFGAWVTVASDKNKKQKYKEKQIHDIHPDDERAIGGFNLGEIFKKT